MAERISKLAQDIQNDNTIPQAERDKAKKVLGILERRSKDKLVFDNSTRSQLTSLFREVTLGDELAASMIEGKLTESESSSSSETEPGEDSELDTSGDETYERLSREGWDDLYIFAKMLSLGYVPNIHSMNHTKTNLNPIKWVWKNKGYISAGGPFSNGQINGKANGMNKWISDKLKSIVLTPETEIKYLLRVLDNKTTGEIGDRTNLNKKIDCLNDLKSALNSGDGPGIKRLVQEYAEISEKTGKIDDLYKKYGVSKRTRQTIQESGDRALVKERANIEADRKALVTQFDTRISQIDMDINNHKATESTQKSNMNSELQTLENEKALIEQKVTSAENAKTTLESDRKTTQGDLTNTLNDLNTELKKKKKNQLEIDRLEQEKLRLEAKIEDIDKKTKSKGTAIQREKNALSKKELEIIAKRSEISGYSYSGESDVKLLSKEKSYLERLKAATASGNHVEGANILRDYHTDFGHPFNFRGYTIPSIIYNPEEVIGTDQKARLTYAEERGRYSFDKSRTIKVEVMSDVISKEIDAITKEIKKIDAEITKLHTKIEEDIKKFEKLASQNPAKAPEFRKEVEKLISEYNTQISKLESAGIEKLKTLDPKSLELVSVESKWARRVVAINGGIDKVSGGFVGKFVGFMAVGLLLKGVYDASSDGLTKTTAKNLVDIGIGMTPLVGGFYDMGMAVRGRDWNDREMSGPEALMRGVLGGVGLIPYAGTVVKSSVLKYSTDIEKSVSKAQKAELAIQTANVSGKAISLSYLGIAGVSTFIYELPIFR